MIAIILGTRPEIIKLSPVIRELKKRSIAFDLIHTNQHYSDDMDEIFFKELNLNKPKFNLKVGGLDRSSMISRIISQISIIYRKKKYKYVIVQGDTNSVLAASLAANFEGIPVGHIEAGLRSFDKGMPEETNRIITDHISTHLFCPTDNQNVILNKEGIMSGIFVLGNTVVDAVYQNLRLAEKNNYFVTNADKYILLTLHRPSNVDDKKTLSSIISVLHKIGKNNKLKILFPVHPRTEQSINKFKIKIDSNIFKVIKPLGYLEMLLAEKNSSLIMTDSGGIQEEACILKIPCITIRNNTERPETVVVGANIIAGNKKKGIIQAVSKTFKSKRDWENPFGRGDTSEKIVDVIENYIKDR